MKKNLHFLWAYCALVFLPIFGLAQTATQVNVSGTGSTLSISNNTASVVDPNLTISSDGTISGFTVQITGGTYASGDLLAYTGTLPSGVTASSFNTTSLSLQFTGVASVAAWQTLLRTVTFKSTTNSCYAQNRQISFIAGSLFYNSLNGHFYQVSSNTSSWQSGFTYAATQSYFGRLGYMVTITSAAENSFVSKVLASDSWIGGTDQYDYINPAVGFTKYANQSASESHFYWVNGPEVGTNYSNGNGSPVTVAGQYANWNGGEPNNAGGENFAEIYVAAGNWNDLNGSQGLHTIIEYGGMSTDNTSSNVVFTRNIAISGAPSGAITGGNVTVCAGTNSSTLTLSGLPSGSSVVKWQYSYDNFLSTSNDISNTTTTYTANNLTQNTFYRAVVNTTSPSCSNLSTSPTSINVNAAVPGNIVADNNTICSGANVNFTLNGYSGSVVKWQVSTSSTFASGITDISNTTAAMSYQINSTGTYYFRAVVLSCSNTVYTNIYSVTCISGTAPIGGAVSTANFCGGSNAGSLSLSGYTGTISKWQYSTSGGVVWTDIANTSATNSFSAITATTQYRVLLTNGACGSAYSSVGYVNVYQASVAGTVSGGATSVCAGTNSTTLSLNGNTGTIQWQSSANNSSFSNIAGATATTYAATNLSATTYYRAVVTNGACSSTNSNAVAVTVKQSSSSTTNASICTGGSYTFNGTAYTSAGTYPVHFTNSVGCDSIANLVLVINTPTSSTTNLTICSAQLPYSWNGLTFNAAGSNSATLTNANGCDSVATLNLTVNNSPAAIAQTIATPSTVCLGSSSVINSAISGATTGFTGIYASNIWTATATNSDGNVDVSNAPASIAITSGNNSSGTNGTNNFTITIPASGTITFDWSYSTSDWGPSFDYPQVIINGVASNLSGYSISGAKNQSGSATYSVSAGDQFTLSMVTADNEAGAATTVFSNFTAPGAISAGSINWYTSATGGTSIGNSTNGAGLSVTPASVGATIYYAENVATNTCASATRTPVTVNVYPTSLDTIVGATTLCLDSTITFSNTAAGGIWSASNINALTITDAANGVYQASAVGNDTVQYTIAAGTSCAVTQTLPITVIDCSNIVTGGSTGGLESKGLGEATAILEFNRARNSQPRTTDYTKAQAVTPARGIQVLGTASSLQDFLPSTTAVQSVLGNGLTTYVTTPSDLLSITNAIDVAALDYTINSTTKAVALATKTLSSVYGHTKPVCDRLKEARLLDVKTISAYRTNILIYTLQQEDGKIEYAASFNAGRNSGNAMYQLQSVWLNDNYQGYDTMYNFQLWSSNEMITRKMAIDVISKFRNAGIVMQVAAPTVPAVYTRQIIRNSRSMDMEIMNNTNATTALLTIIPNKTELTTQTAPYNVTVAINPMASTVINIPYNDNYEANISLATAGTTLDAVYTNDGPWSIYYDKAKTNLHSYSIAQDNILPTADEWRLNRDVTVTATSNDYINIYKMVKAGALAKNLTAYKGIRFAGNTDGVTSLKVTFVKASVLNWDDQYSITVPAGNTVNGDYQISFSDLTNAKGDKNFTPNDLTTVVISYINNTGSTTNMNISVSNLRFTTIDDKYIHSLSDKALGLYPNPNNGVFTCNFKSDKAGIFTLQITDAASGRIVHTEKINVVVGVNTANISMNKGLIASGMYIVNLFNETKTYDHQLMLKK